MAPEYIPTCKTYGPCVGAVVFTRLLHHACACAPQQQGGSAEGSNLEGSSAASGDSLAAFKTQSSFGLRWFTPEAEVPLCGHATLASSHVIYNGGLSAAA